jgi:hypothetical protein
MTSRIIDSSRCNDNLKHPGNDDAHIVFHEREKTMPILWFWLFVSLIPYQIERQKQRNLSSFTVLALFWQFTFTCQGKHSHWSVSLPWITRLHQLQSVRTIFTQTMTKMLQEAASKLLSLFT